MSKYYLAIDQGTTGTTALLFDRRFQKIARGYSETKSYYPAPTRVEHDPAEILRGIKAAVSSAMHQADVAPEEIRCIGIDHEGESILLWDGESGKALSPVIVWQDGRTAALCKQLQQDPLYEARSYLTPEAYFSAPKIKWAAENIEECKALRGSGRLRASNLDAWILYNLTGSYATDLSTASRTMLADLRQGKWDEEILQSLDLEDVELPPIRDSAALFGHTDPRKFLGIRAPVTALLNDQQAALLGQGCLQSGQVKTTYGTGCFMLMNTGHSPKRSHCGLVPTAAWQFAGEKTYALDGGIYIAGAAIGWLRDGLGIIENAAETAALARSKPDNGGVYFVPAFTGLGSPYRDPDAKSVIVGLTAATTRAHIVRATLESIAYQVADVLDAMQADSGVHICELRCDGGVAQNEFLMQFQADILGLPILAAEESDATALGAALCAALGHSDITDEEIAALPRAFRRYEPHMAESERTALRAGWLDAVHRARKQGQR